jgi:hypothetical protein
VEERFYDQRGDSSRNNPKHPRMYLDPDTQMFDVIAHDFHVSF